MKHREQILLLTRTAVFLAMIIAAQLVTLPFGSTLLTGSLVNLILIITVMMNGFVSGVSVAALSPVFAKLFGIGPLWAIVPCIAAGNIALITIWYALGNEFTSKPFITSIISAVLAAALKLLILFLLIPVLVIPLLKLPEAQAAAISTAFTMPQLVTALIGGGLAVLLLPGLEQAIRLWEKNKK